MSDWLIVCPQERREELARAAKGVDREARALFVGSADALRRTVAGSAPGEFCVMVGPVGEGVSDVNLAAAIAEDGGARRVVLASDGASGSLRSRASRAGIELVVDLSELAEGGAAGQTCVGDGGPGQAAAASALPPVEPQAPAPAEARAAVVSALRSYEGAEKDHGVLDFNARRGAVIALCSGRGGVGKTSVAAVACVVAASWGMRACLLDLDLSCGNAHSLFGVTRGPDLARLAGSSEPVAQTVPLLIHTVAPGVSMVGPCERPEDAELVAPQARELLGALADEFDLVVADTSTTFTDAVAQAAQAADRLVLVSDGRAGSVASLARVSGLAVRLGVARTRIVRLENRSDVRARCEAVAGRAEVGLEVARVLHVFEGGPETGELLAAGQASDVVEIGGPFPDSVAAALAQLLSELGRLPECEAARRAAESGGRRRRGLFRMRGEAS